MSEKIMINNVSDLLYESFSKVEGYDYRWQTLITSQPLLFEDIDYLRVYGNIDNQITEKEKEAYSRKDLSEIYATFDNMLMCNLLKYDRIMSFCTMTFYRYMRTSDFNQVEKYLDKTVSKLQMTPTQIYCAALTNEKSTLWELEYGWGVKLKTPPGSEEGLCLSPLQYNWKTLYKNENFRRFVEYRALITGQQSKNFRGVLAGDITDNIKLNMVTQKFTNTSAAIAEGELNTLYQYYLEVNAVTTRLYYSLMKSLLPMFNNESKQIAIYVFLDEIRIITELFEMTVKKSWDDKQKRFYLVKEYNSGGTACFQAESFLINSMEELIRWGNYTMTKENLRNQEILKIILVKMLRENHRNIKVHMLMGDQISTNADIRFKGVFHNFTAVETLFLNGKPCRIIENTFGAENLATLLINKGYIIFGEYSKIKKFINPAETFKAEEMVAHYSGFCISILQYMEDIITANEILKNQVVDIVYRGLPEAKINTEKRYVDFYGTYDSNTKTSRKIMNILSSKDPRYITRETVGSYYRVITDRQIEEEEAEQEAIKEEKKKLARKEKAKIKKQNKNG